ncbi:hypothetical protein ACRRTK_005227 [Alexandromys fortis]
MASVERCMGPSLMGCVGRRCTQLCLTGLCREEVDTAISDRLCREEVDTAISDGLCRGEVYAAVFDRAVLMS